MLANRYELQGRLGTGGAGDVYEAWDRRLERPVAVKLLRLGDPTDRARFAREARTAASVRHPNVVAVYDASLTGAPYLVMELLPGETLASEIARGPLDPARTCEVGAGILDGLAAVHAAGLVHRDVKPSNILLDRDGTPKLGDFGIAKAGDATLTRTGQVVGSLPYLAPEVLRGQPATPSSDIYAVGVTLDTALRGTPTLARDSPAETMAAVLDPRAGTAWPAHVPDELGALLEGAMDPDPARRPADAAALATALRALAARARVPEAAATDTATEPFPAVERTRVMPATPVGAAVAGAAGRTAAAAATGATTTEAPTGGDGVAVATGPAAPPGPASEPARTAAWREARSRGWLVAAGAAAVLLLVAALAAGTGSGADGTPGDTSQPARAESPATRAASTAPAPEASTTTPAPVTAAPVPAVPPGHDHGGGHPGRGEGSDKHDEHGDEDGDD